jgi:pimeloyl-ACP methyl ester carboxylesterase
MTREARSDHRIVSTSGGRVEVLIREEPDQPHRPILYFHGGHESATTAPASELYVELGHPVIRVSRPGYGHTDVGLLSPAAFAPVVDQVRALLDIDRFTAVVGTSFGGPQAIEYVGRYPARTTALILHSAAPSTLSYPDSTAQRLLGPLMFHPSVERYSWRAVKVLMHRAPQIGLRLMLSSLSTQPVSSWLPRLNQADRQAMRDVFSSMRSGRGFVIDSSYAGADHQQTRRTAQQRVSCPTLITASRQDRGVAWAHAEDLAATIPPAHLEELPAPSHLFWIGPPRNQLLAVTRGFLAALPH